MMSIALIMFWFVGIGMGFMFLYWLIIELPVLVRINTMNYLINGVSNVRP